MTATQYPRPRTAGRFLVTPVYDAGNGATFTVPGMDVSDRELRAIFRDTGVRAIWCNTCGESVVDCPHARGVVGVHAPGHWATEGTGAGWVAAQA